MAWLQRKSTPVPFVFLHADAQPKFAADWFAAQLHEKTDRSSTSIEKRNADGNLIYVRKSCATDETASVSNMAAACIDWNGIP